MLGTVTNNTAAGSRYFRYEVVGLHQNDQTDRNDHQIRSSASQFFTVPYSRMNQEMQRITRMGGRIVNIHPMNNGAESANDNSQSNESGSGEV